ncbi:MAG: hypothetical protein IPP14_15150 [Planctomycetes bacterium]|nr:hypothetical protein [Planctomycetota bacterium]
MTRVILTSLLMAFAVLPLISCRETAEFFSFTGKPEGDNGWLQDYESTPKDTWEAFRLVAKQNGRIDNENPDTMELRCFNLSPDSSEKEGYTVKGRVYDKTKGTEIRSRLIVHAWFAKSADGGARQDIAKEYSNAVWRVLKQWKGGDVEPGKTPIDTTSENPVAEDEAVSYFRVKPGQAFEACEAVAKLYGSVEQAEKDKGFLRAVKQNPLEKTRDDVRISVYDRTEGETVRVKVSVRVRDGADNKPLQEIAKAYVSEIRKELEKRFGADAGKDAGK